MFAGMQSLWYPMLMDLLIYEQKWRRQQERRRPKAISSDQ